ncbi:MAG: hypothetical protein ACLFQP_07120 [Halothece sp.]
MFEQFRRHFPRGSLISELVQIDHGKYIVRASVQNEGLTLATGLAAAETVEEAEDQARTRALAVLEISLTPSPTENASSKRESKSVAASPENSSPNAQSINQPNSHQSNTLPPPVSPSQEPPASPKPTPEPVQKTSNASQEQQTVTSPKDPQSAVNGSNTSEETVTDSSDIIARTNVELRRLRWTSEQGRKFLQETYGKRSRTLLSDSELRQFLEYLEQQPTPPEE